MMCIWKLVTTVTTLVITASAIGHSTDGTVDEHEEPRERLVLALQALSDGAESLRSTIRMSELPPYQTEWPDVDPAALADAPALHEQEIQWARHDNRLLISPQQPADGTADELIWTGQEWFDRFGDQLSISPRPRQLLRYEYLPPFNGGIEWWSFLASPRSLSQLAEAYTLLEISDDDDGTCFRFATSPNLDVAARVEMRISSWSPFQISSLTLEALGPPGSEHAGEPVIRRQLVFLSWTTNDTWHLPDKALFLEAGLKRKDAGISVTRLERITLDHLETGPSTDALFDTQRLFEANTLVVDRCNDLQYTVGNTVVFVGDNDLSVDAPIEDRITAAELEKLLEESNDSRHR